MPKRTKVFPAAKLVRDLRKIEDLVVSWRKEVEAAVRATKTGTRVEKAGGPKPIVGGACPPP